jgi:hypothetical protein
VLYFVTSCPTHRVTFDLEPPSEQGGKNDRSLQPQLGAL